MESPKQGLKGRASHGEVRFWRRYGCLDIDDRAMGAWGANTEQHTVVLRLPPRVPIVSALITPHVGCCDFWGFVLEAPSDLEAEVLRLFWAALKGIVLLPCWTFSSSLLHSYPSGRSRVKHTVNAACVAASQPREVPEAQFASITDFL